MALVTVILIVALAAGIAAFMARQQQLWGRQVENLRDQAQAQAVSRAALDWARAILADDARKNNVDHPGERWAMAPGPLPVENGSVSGSVTDQQGLFNLNNLVRNGKASPPDVEIFRRLLSALGLPLEIANATLDWIDADSNTSLPGGAEDIDYLGLDQPYRAANRLLTEPGNLSRVKGIDQAMVERLRPFVTALPEPTQINVNTAPAEVLAALFPDLSLADASALVEARKAGYFTNQSDFRSRLPAAKSNQIKDSEFSVNSRYFMISVAARFGRAHAGYKAIVARIEKEWPVIVWKRSD